MSDSESPPPKPTNLSEAGKIAMSDPIWAWRGYAIGAYSLLELALFTLFHGLLGARPELSDKQSDQQREQEILKRLLSTPPIIGARRNHRRCDQQAGAARHMSGDRHVVWLVGQNEPGERIAAPTSVRSVLSRIGGDAD